MRKVFLFALILMGTLAAGREPCPERRPGQTPNPRSSPALSSLRQANRIPKSRISTVRVTRTRIALTRPAAPLPPVSAPPIVTPSGTIIEGVLPNLIRAPNPLQMFNPFSPPEYPSARNFVVYTEEDPYSTTTNTIRFQPEGVRLLTVRPLW